MLSVSTSSPANLWYRFYCLTSLLNICMLVQIFSVTSSRMLLEHRTCTANIENGDNVACLLSFKKLYSVKPFAS